MNCAEVQDVLEELAAGELEPSTAARAEAHLSACAGCARSLEQARKLVALLGSVPLPEVSEGFFERQRSAILERLGRPLDWHAPKLSLLLLLVVVSGYVGFSMGPLMDWVIDLAGNSARAWAGLDGVAPLYGLMMLMALFAFTRDAGPAYSGVRR